ncbi:MAG TPA: hotdog domain-containing protein [Mycobacteriales bacterium]|nr:hotdog domain-containing protein [Mycobacteriales bacterium]
MPITPGRTGRASLVVSEDDTAIALGSGDVGVLGTPRVVALCEEATVAAVRDALAPDETTVGVRVEVEHLRPSLPGATVTATATLEAVEGRRLRFAVAAEEEGQLVARGTVDRALVSRALFGGGSSGSE